MWTAERAVAELVRRGDVWLSAPGLVGLRGATLALFQQIERAVARLADRETREQWLVPAGIPLPVLARADYFASFPQWLTLASHLSADEAELGRVATAFDPAEAARRAHAPADAALPPAVCYHVYGDLAHATLTARLEVTAQSTCWRHEAEGFSPLSRGWAFTMREIVCLGTEAEVTAFRTRTMREACELARALDLEPCVQIAEDPFFAPTARGKALLQQVKALKHELKLPLGDGRTLAAASFNHHERFFGEAFDIRLEDGTAAHTACTAFGLERWLLAVLVRYGPDPAAWPVPDVSPALGEVL
jgi:seryl-tRNA synthetase